MSTPNANIPEKVYSALKTHYGLESDKALADFLSVDYRTLAAWKSRGKIAKVDQFINKCSGISIEFLKTGEGEMFVTPITGASHEGMSFSEKSVGTVGEQQETQTIRQRLGTQDFSPQVLQMAGFLDLMTKDMTDEERDAFARELFEDTVRKLKDRKK